MTRHDYIHGSQILGASLGSTERDGSWTEIVGSKVAAEVLGYEIPLHSGDSDSITERNGSWTEIVGDINRILGGPAPSEPKSDLLPKILFGLFIGGVLLYGGKHALTGR